LRISTGKDGGFAMKMPEGQYRLEIQRSGYLTYSRNVKISAGKTTRRDFRLRRAVEHVKQETAKIASLGAIGKASPQSTDKTTSGTAVSVPRISDSEISRITATQKAAVVKDRNGRIEGRITDSRTRRGIADASVTLEKAGNTKSDRSGAFKLEAVKPGRYRLSVSAKGYLSTKKTITVTEGRTLKVNVDLTQPVKTVAPPATIKKIK
jgi:uncharacterized membrane protein